MGFFDRIKKLGRLDAPQAEEPSREPGDLIEPGSAPDASARPAGAGGGAATIDQLKGLRDSGLIDAETFATIETTLHDASAQIEQLHASGMMSDEIYAQAIAGMNAATAGAGASVDAADLELLRTGATATATVLAPPESVGQPDAQPRVKLEVHPATGAPYPVDCAIGPVPPGTDLRTGDFLRVKVDPEDPTRVAIDWTGFEI
jgi:hypothetical protein